MADEKDVATAGEKRERPRVIVTTDIEVDDMNSVVHLALYLNELDVEAFVYTSSQYHFLGDGEHTLGQVNPHWRTKGRRSYEWEHVPHEPDPEAGSLTSYRPFPEGWIERLWSGPYAAAWPHLCENGGSYPSPEELVARTHVGNVAFEGDVREETPGSRVIEDAILADIEKQEADGKLAKREAKRRKKHDKRKQKDKDKMSGKKKSRFGFGKRKNGKNDDAAADVDEKKTDDVTTPDEKAEVNGDEKKQEISK